MKKHSDKLDGNWGRYNGRIGKLKLVSQSHTPSTGTIESEYALHTPKKEKIPITDFKKLLVSEIIVGVLKPGDMICTKDNVFHLIDKISMDGLITKGNQIYPIRLHSTKTDIIYIQPQEIYGWVEKDRLLDVFQKINVRKKD